MTDSDASTPAAAPERPLRRFEVRLVRSAFYIETGTAVVEGEDEEDARDWAMENVYDIEDRVEWFPARRKHEEVEVEGVREVPPDTPLTAPPQEEEG